MTGVGYPQLSATIECSDAAHGLGGHIITDGGCTVPGDIAKAFGAGSDFVMLGGMLAGHWECAWDDEEEDPEVTGKFSFNWYKIRGQLHQILRRKSIQQRPNTRSIRRRQCKRHLRIQ